MELNINPTNLTNESGTIFFEIKNANVINILGNLGIGTDIPLSDFHIENVQFDDKVLQIPTASNIYNYRNPEKVYSLVPTGSIIIYPTDNTERLSHLNRLGWYECNGQTLLGSNFPILSKVLAGQFGNTDPVATYLTLPDFRDKVGIGSTVVGYISPDDTPIYASPSNLYSNTMISSINNDYSIGLTYNHLPGHRHFTTDTGPAIPSAGDGSHSHVYNNRESTAEYLSASTTIDRGITTRQTSDTPSNYRSHHHDTFNTYATGNQSITDTVLGTFSRGPLLTGESISIRQATFYMIYLIKCL